MPIMEYPYDPSWGITRGLFCTDLSFWASTRIYGSVDRLHQAGIGVILVGSFPFPR
jgi:1,4-alpha-glucan branching enzyme